MIEYLASLPLWQLALIIISLPIVWAALEFVISTVIILITACAYGAGVIVYHAVKIIRRRP